MRERDANSGKLAQTPFGFLTFSFIIMLMMLTWTSSLFKVRLSNCHDRDLEVVKCISVSAMASLDYLLLEHKIAVNKPVHISYCVSASISAYIIACCVGYIVAKNQDVFIYLRNL